MQQGNTQRKLFKRPMTWVVIAAVVTLMLIVNPGAVGLFVAFALPVVLLGSPFAIVGYVVYRIVRKNESKQHHYFTEPGTYSTAPQAQGQPFVPAYDPTMPYQNEVPYQNDPMLAQEANLMENDPALAEALDLDGEDPNY